MVLALEGLHKLRLLHRDVKPNNIVYTRDGYAVLADLGLVASIADGVARPTSRTGSRGYCTRAPALATPTSRLAHRLPTLDHSSGATHPCP